MTYAEQLKHPKWQRRRLEILNRAGFTCEDCGDDQTTLHVHHKIYRKGSKVWEYADHELVALCETCHAAETLLRAELAEWLAFFGATDLETLLGYAKGIYALKAWDDHELRAKKVPVGSAEQAEALGGALGLTFMESQYMLCRREPFSTAELQTIQTACGRLERHAGPRAYSVDELVALAAVVPVPETEL